MPIATSPQVESKETEASKPFLWLMLQPLILRSLQSLNTWSRKILCHQHCYATLRNELAFVICHLYSCMCRYAQQGAFTFLHVVLKFLLHGAVSCPFSTSTLGYTSPHTLKSITQNTTMRSQPRSFLIGKNMVLFISVSMSPLL